MVSNLISLTIVNSGWIDYRSQDSYANYVSNYADCVSKPCLILDICVKTVSMIFWFSFLPDKKIQFTLTAVLFLLVNLNLFPLDTFEHPRVQGPKGAGVR